MEYYFKKNVKNQNFEHVKERVTELLKEEGFGILTEIDMRTTLKNKLGVNINEYIILGACNPPFAYKAYQIENKIGTLLPCNVVLQKLEDDSIEIAAIDPVVSMSIIKNDNLTNLADEIKLKLKNVIEKV